MWICCGKSALLNTIWLEGPKCALQAQVLVSASDYLYNGASLMEMYECPPGLCAIKRLTGLQWQPRIFWRNFCNYFLVACICILWKMHSQFRPIFTCIDHFSLVHVFVKTNMISNVHLIVTNIQMWKDLGIYLHDWPRLTPLCEVMHNKGKLFPKQLPPFKLIIST